MIKCDAFTSMLLTLARRVYSGEDHKPVDEDVRLHLLRNDFLPTDGDRRILQVEINTISAGFAGVLESLSQLHRSNRAVYYPSLRGEFPENLPCTRFAEAMSVAVDLHNKKWGTQSRVIVFVVEEGERNIVDQYALDYRLSQQHGITVLRRSLGQLALTASIELSGQLCVDGIEISLVYFRSGYDPKHYPTPKEWEARHLLERSRSVKCPSLLGQLAGTKKVQQLWYEDGGRHLKNFGLSDSEIALLFEVFAIQTDPSVDAVSRAKAVGNAENWVLKPQREGGGNNLYGNELKEALSTLTKDQLSQYVLMERMNPLPQPALVVDGERTVSAGTIVPAVVEESVSEVGLYSFYIPALNRNEVCGHLVRTKEKSVTEGGVNAGYAVLDTLHLV